MSIQPLAALPRQAQRASDQGYLLAGPASVREITLIIKPGLGWLSSAFQKLVEIVVHARGVEIGLFLKGAPQVSRPCL